MRKILWVCLLVILGFTSVGVADQSKLTIAVVDFTNQSGWRMPQIEEYSNEILSTLLFQTGRFDVVERAKLASIIREQGLSMSGLVDSTKSSIQVGKLLGADYIATGSILSYNAQAMNFQGYGIQSQTILIDMSVNVKILNINTGKVEFSSTFKVQDKVLNTSSSSTVTVGRERIMLERALHMAIADLTAFLDAKAPVVPNKVKVLFQSAPEGADVEIDNVFYGNTPLEIEINPGLHPVKVSIAGYEPWEKTINAYDGLVVKVTLVKKN